jgi:hypothetical protein
MSPLGRIPPADTAPGRNCWRAPWAGLGGWLGAQLGIGGPPIMSWVMAVVGAAILIAILRALGLFK